MLAAGLFMLEIYDYIAMKRKKILSRSRMIRYFFCDVKSVVIMVAVKLFRIPSVFFFYT